MLSSSQATIHLNLTICFKIKYITRRPNIDSFYFVTSRPFFMKLSGRFIMIENLIAIFFKITSVFEVLRFKQFSKDQFVLGS